MDTYTDDDESSTKTSFINFHFITFGFTGEDNIMINNLLSAGSVVIVSSAFEPLLTTPWTNCGRVKRIRCYFCHERPSLISLHLPNKRLTSFLLATHIFVSQK